MTKTENDIPLLDFFDYPFRTVTRKEAQIYFAEFQEQVTVRITILEQKVHLDKSKSSQTWRASLLPDSLDFLGGWFIDQVQTTPLTDKMKTERDLLRNKASSIVRLMLDRQPSWILSQSTFDTVTNIGIYLGETLSKSRHQLQWKLETKKDINFHQPVLAGFKNQLTCQPINLIHGLALKIANGDIRSTGIRDLFEIWVDLA